MTFLGFQSFQQVHHQGPCSQVTFICNFHLPPHLVPSLNSSSFLSNILLISQIPVNFLWREIWCCFCSSSRPCPWDLLSHTQVSLSICFSKKSLLPKSLVSDVTLSPCDCIKPRSDSLKLLLSNSLQPALSWLTPFSEVITIDRKNTGFRMKLL